MRKDAYWSGWGEFRYGRTSGRKVYDPGKAARQPKVNKDKHEHLVRRTRDVLLTFTFTPFEHEGACRAGIRSGLCMEGFPWVAADTEAATVLSQALGAIRARRPTWEEGQRQYTVPREACQWCHGPMPEDSQSENRKFQYCSSVCAKAAFENRSFEDRTCRDKAYAAAYRAIRRGRTKSRRCKFCEKPFHPIEESSTQEFCSMSCRRRWFAIHQPPQFNRTCGECGKDFVASAWNAKYCSQPCKDVADRKLSGRFKYDCAIFPGECAECARPFVGKDTKSKYCSVTCQQKAHGRKRAAKPKHLTPARFDRAIRMAA